MHNTVLALALFIQSSWFRFEWKFLLRHYGEGHVLLLYGLEKRGFTQMTEMIWIVNNFPEYLCVNPHEDWGGSNVFLPIFLRPLGNYWEFSYSSASFSLLVLRRPLWKRGTRREQASCGLHRPHTANSGHYIAKEFQLFGKELFPILILTQLSWKSTADKQLVHLCHQALLVDFFCSTFMQLLFGLNCMAT